MHNARPHMSPSSNETDIHNFSDSMLPFAIFLLISGLARACMGVRISVSPSLNIINIMIMVNVCVCVCSLRIQFIKIQIYISLPYEKPFWRFSAYLSPIVFWDTNLCLKWTRRMMRNGGQTKISRSRLAGRNWRLNWTDGSCSIHSQFCNGIFGERVTHTQRGARIHLYMLKTKFHDAFEANIKIKPHK